MADNNIQVTGNFTDNISPALKQIESGIIRVVGAFSALSTALATVGAPVLLAAEYQKQLLEVQKTTDYTAKATAYLGRELLNLSKTINVSANDLAKIAALGGQLGIGDSGAQALVSFTEEIARAVTALDVDAELAATSLGKLINIFNIDPSKYRNVIATINQLSNVSTAKPEELFDILRRIGNLGGSVSIDQATALSAVMIDLGLTAETAGTSLTKVFADMKSSAGDFANFVGMTTDQWSQTVEKDGIGALKLYLTTLNKMPPAIAAATKAQLTGEGRIFGLITKLQEEMAKGGGLLDKRLLDASTEIAAGTSAMKEQQNVLSGLSAQFQVFKNKVSALFIGAGEQTLAPLTQSLRSLGDALSSQSTVDAFVASARILVDTLTRVGNALASVTSFLGSTGIDWGRLLQLGAMLALVQGAKSMAGALDFLGKSLRGSFSGANTQANAGAQQVESLWSKATRTVFNIGTAYESAAIAARVSAAQQIASAASVRASQQAAQLGIAAQAASTQARAYAARWVQPLINKQTAGTITAQEQIQLQTRVANHARMVAEANAILQGHVNTSAAAQVAITNTQSAQLRIRLNNYLTALRAEEQAQRLVNFQQSQAQRAYDAGIPEQSPKAPSTIARLAAAASQLRASGVSAYLASMAGYASAYAVATGTAARATIVLTSALTLLGRAVSFVLTRLLGWVAWGVTLVELGSMALEFLGVLDRVKDAAWAVMKIFGASKRPEFLSNKNVEADKQRATQAYEELIAEKQKFEQRFGTIPINLDMRIDNAEVFQKGLASVMSSVESARAALAKRLTFTLDNPGDAAKAVTESLDVIDKLVAGVAGASAEYDKLRAELNAVGLDISASEQAYSKLVAAQGADSTRAKDKAKELDDLRIKYAQLAIGVDQASTVLFRTSQGLEKQIASTMSFLDQPAATDLFLVPTKSGESLIETLQNLKKAQQAVADEAKRGSGITDLTAGITNTSSFSKEQLDLINKQRDAYVIYGKEMDNVRAKLMSLDSLKRLFVNDAARAKFIDTLIGQADTLAARAREASRSVGGIASLAQGLGAIVVPTGNTPDKLAGQIAVWAEGKKAYSELSKVAMAAANDAKNAVARALDKNKQDYKAFTEFMVRIRRNLESQQDRATAQNQTRAIDDGAATRQAGMNTVKALENDILNTIMQEGQVSQADIAARLNGLERAKMFAQDQLSSMFLTGKISKETFDRESKALNDNMAMQREVLGYYYDRTGVTKEEAAAIQGVLDLKYRVADKKIIDSAEAQKSVMVLDNTAAAFKRMDAEAMKHAGTLQYVERELNKENVTADQKVKLLEQRNTAQAALTASLGQMRSEAEKFSNVDPVAGKVLVDGKQVAEMQDTIKRFTDAQANFNLSTAGKDQSIYTSYANQLNAVAQSFDVSITKAKEMAAAMQVNEEQLAKYVTVAKSLPEVQAAMQQMKDTLTNAASGTVANVNTADILKNVNAAIQGIDPTQISQLPPVEFQAKLAQNSLSETVKDIAPLMAQGMQDGVDAFNAKGAVKIKGEMDITKVNIPAQSVEGALQPFNNRDGGYIQAFAGGGDVRGAGTGRSDSILSWLSHGEYVMDATTVRMLGSGFFRTLQGLAQRGTNLSGLKASMGAFALGGPVTMPGLAVPGMDGVLQSISNGGGDTTNLDISMNGVKRSRLRGSREQVDNFVSAIRDLQKGMAK